MLVSVVILCLWQRNMRKFMYRAHERGLTGSEFAYIYYTLMPSEFIEQPWEHDENVTEEEYTSRKKAFTPLKMVRT